VLYDQGDLAGARAAFERALAIDEKIFGPDHPRIAGDVGNLGTVLYDQDNLAGARAAFERALRVLEKFLPPDHPKIKLARENLESLEAGE
jgi:Tfp pilus assembly protein PilF